MPKMAKTKIVADVAISFEHPDGTKLGKAKIAAQIKEALQSLDVEAFQEGAHVTKVTMRAVDFD